MIAFSVRMTSWVGVAVLLLVSAAQGIQPASWVHTNEADFQAGEMQDTVITNLGDVTLATGTQVIGTMPEQASIVYDVQVIDEVMYLAAGPTGKLLRKDGDAITVVAELPGEQVFALGTYAGNLLVAISGTPSRLAMLTGDTQLKDLVTLPDVRYIWDVVVEEGSPIFYLATGTEGKLLMVQLPNSADAEPRVTELLDAAQANLLCLGRDGEGRLYVGTDTDGLVYRVGNIGSETPETFVIYDAAEPEIGALVVTAEGVVYAGTADAEQARPGRLGEPAAEEAGRPETMPAPPEDGEVPEPGDLPQVPPAPTPIGDEEDDGEAPSAVEAIPSDGQVNETATEAEITASDADEVGEAEDATVEEPGAPVFEEAQEAEQETAEEQEPTAEQYDRLRALVRSRLEEARKGGALQTPPGGPMREMPPGGANGQSRARPMMGPTSQPKEGNAIYRIDEQGFVTEVFRESVMILRMIEEDGRLLVATGNEGQIFRVDPSAEETVNLADLEAEQVPAMALSRDGRILLGTANPAELILLGQTYASRGTYTGPPMDAGQISLWGTLSVTVAIGEGTSVTVETRSGNVADPEQAPWSAWSLAQALMPDAQLSALTPREMKVQSPPGRFLQYRLTLVGGDQTTPVVGKVQMTYVTPNQRPQIASIKASYPEVSGGPMPQHNGEEAPPSTKMNIEWEASDPNQDELIYTLEYQPAGSAKYLPLAEDQEQTSYEWETRRVPDGRYVVRLTADDQRNNPPDMAKKAIRRSDPVLVDNTPPMIEGLEKAVEGRVVAMKGVVRDEYSQIREIGYAVDVTDAYVAVLPEDLIFDSTEEAWSVRISDLSPGPHVVTLRVGDARGNRAYQSVLIEVK
jgi:hypothetical protein